MLKSTMGTKYQGTEAETRALDTYIKLTRAANSLLDRTNRHLDAYHLTPSQFGALEALYHLGTLSQVELSRKLLLSTANITTVLQNLEKRALICRERDAHDQRYVNVSITEAGAALVAQILPSHVASITADMSILTPEEQETLGALSKKLGRQGK
jgi:MarR family 2-MHQ and catechol resistance regulon transcriptional repressor